MRRAATLISSLLVAASLSASAEYVFRVPAPIRSGAELAPHLSFSPQSLSFDVAVGSSQTLAARLSNTGAGAADALQLSGPLAPYSATHTCGVSLAAGESCDFDITFTPTAAGPAGDGVQARSGTAGIVLGLGGTGRQGQFAVDPTSLAFGDVNVGASTSLTATLRNTGNAALPVSFGALAAPYSLTHTCGATLAAGANCTLSVTFAPTVTGNTSSSLTIGSGATGVVLEVSGTGRQGRFVVDPTSLAFGDVDVGASASLTASLSNSGNAALPVSFGAMAAPYSLSHDCPASLVPAGTCTLTVAFAPTVTGTASANLALGSGDVSVVLGVSGTGRQSKFVVDPTSLDFGDVDVGASTSLSAMLSNSGNAALPVSFGALAAPYSLTHTCGATLAAGASCTLTVTFAPTVTGAASANLAIGSGDAGATLAMSGVGKETTVFIDAAGGDKHSVFLDSTGAVWSVGFNDKGQLGLGDLATRVLKTPVTGLATVVSQVSAANGRSFAIGINGTLWSAGYNPNGQLGDGTTTDRSTFVQASGVTDARYVSAGSFHTVFLKFDGTVWGAGQNGAGQLGLGNTTGTMVFKQAINMTNVDVISAGNNYTLALKADGTLWATGVNGAGQFGDGTTTNSLTFKQVLTGVQAMAASAFHSLALKTDGTLWATGRNTGGQLGDGTTTDRSTFAQVLAGVQAMAAGGAHTIALKTDGTLWATGANNYGQLGDGTTTNRNTFQQVMSDVQAVYAGENHTLALKNDGTLWVTGMNDRSQLGLGDTKNRNVFTRLP